MSLAIPLVFGLLTLGILFQFLLDGSSPPASSAWVDVDVGTPSLFSSALGVLVALVGEILHNSPAVT